MDQEHLQAKWKKRAYMGIALVTGCALVYVLLYLFGIMWQAVAVIVLTAIFSFMLHGLVNYLEARGIKRMGATAIAMLAFLLLIVAAFASVIPAITEQVAAFSASAPSYLAGARTIIEDSLSRLPVDEALASSFIDQVYTWIQEESGGLLQAAASGILSGIVDVGNWVLIVFVAFICSFWVLLDLPTIGREVMLLFNDEQQKNVRVISGAFNTAVYGWAKATLICAIIVGVLNGFAYWLLSVPYFALLGLICGVLYFIPYIGSMLAALVVVVVALLVSPLVAVLALVINMVVHNVVANIISPKLMESSVNVHPAIILVVILIGGAFGGIVGMLFSIPVAAAIQGVFVTFFEERTGKQLATEEGALFQKPKTKYTPTWRKRPRKAKVSTAETMDAVENKD